MILEAEGLYFDYSKQRVTEKTLQLLLQLARESGVRDRINAMFRGEKINVTEQRAVLHVALRMPKGQSITVDGVDVVSQIHAMLDKMSDFSNRLRNGQLKGYTGKTIRNIINVGIGGSDLGPVMAYEALRHYSCRELGINLDEVTQQLEGEGVEKFIKPFDQLMATLEKDYVA